MAEATPSGVNSSVPHGIVSCKIKDGFLSQVLPTCYIVIFIVGLISNTVSVGVFFLRKRFESSITVYMRHLALADLLLVLCLPVRIYYHNTEGPFILCKLVGTFFYINMYASIMFLSLISLDRYLKIIKPVGVFRIHRVEWSCRAACSIWLVLLCSMLLLLLGNSGSGPCDKICFHFHQKGTPAGIVNLVVVFLFAVIFLLFVHFYRKISTKLRTMTLGSREQQARRKKKRIMAKTFVVPAVFTLCFVPYHLVRVPYVLAQMGVVQEVGSKQTLHFLNELGLSLSALNSCLDPVVYFFLSATFRKTILCVIQGQFKNVYAMNQRGISLNKSANDMEMTARNND